MFWYHLAILCLENLNDFKLLFGYTAEEYRRDFIKIETFLDGYRSFESFSLRNDLPRDRLGFTQLTIVYGIMNLVRSGYRNRLILMT